MGQKAHSTGLRLGVALGWDSSWSSNPAQKGQDYRHHLHMDLEIRNLITQLFASRNGHVGKIGVSKNPNTGITDISVFGYVPGKVKKKFVRRGSKDLTKPVKKPVVVPEVEDQLNRLVEVLNEKYSPEILTLRCVLVRGLVSQKGRQFKTRRPRRRFKGKRRPKNRKSRKLMLKRADPECSKKPVSKYSKPRRIPLRTKFSLKRKVTNKRGKNKPWRSGFQKGTKAKITFAMKEFKYLGKSKYFDSLINIGYLTFKAKEPQLLASLIARELGRPALAKTRRQRVFYYQTADICAFFFKMMPLIGLRIQISGRLNKSKRSRKFVTQFGRIPSQTITKSVRYGFDEAYTSFGSMGIKVWLAYEL